MNRPYFHFLSGFVTSFLQFGHFVIFITGLIVCLCGFKSFLCF